MIPKTNRQICAYNSNFFFKFVRNALKNTNHKNHINFSYECLSNTLIIEIESLVWLSSFGIHWKIIVCILEHGLSCCCRWIWIIIWIIIWWLLIWIIWLRRITCLALCLWIKPWLRWLAITLLLLLLVYKSNVTYSKTLLRLN